MKNKYNIYFLLFLLPFGVLIGQTCTNPIPFTWEGASSGNKAVWSVNDTLNTYRNIGGVDVQVKLIDIFKKNTNTSNPSEFNDYTKSNAFFGNGALAFQITSDKSKQQVCLEFRFSEPVILDHFDVWDIDFLTIADRPYSSYQDSFSVVASDQAGNVPLFMYAKSPTPSFNIVGQSAFANYFSGVNGNLLHTDPNGAVTIKSTDVLNKFTICYSNGSLDEGFSNSHALKIGDIGFCAPTLAPLPVSLLSLKASWIKENLARLQWNVSREINNDHYTVILSEDGLNFTNAGIVVAKPSPSLKNTYAFDFENPYDGISYIALEQTDLDGRSSRLGIVKMVKDRDKVNAVISPNPVYDIMQLKIDGGEGKDTEFSIIDSGGKIWQKGYIKGSGEQNSWIPMQVMPRGNYFVQIKNGDKMISRSIIKM